MSTGARELTGLRRAITRVYQMYWGSGLVDDVPAMAWFLVTACVPLSLGIVAVASIVLGDAQQANAVARKLAAVLPSGARGQVLELVLRTRRDSPWLLALSIGSMIWACSGATGVIERMESRLLSLPRRTAVKLKLRQLMLAAAMAMMIALLAIAAVEATDLRSRLGIHVPGWVLTPAAVPVIAVICALLYRNATVRRLDCTPSLRGRGLGRKLLIELCAESERGGLYKLTSRVFTDNEPSRAAHRAAGFEEVGIQRRHGKLDGQWKDCVLVEHLLGAAAD